MYVASFTGFALALALAARAGTLEEYEQQDAPQAWFGAIDGVGYFILFQLYGRIFSVLVMTIALFKLRGVLEKL